MSLFNERDKSAVLVIDVQNGVVKGAYSRDEVVAHINSLIASARGSSVPVIWVQHSDEELVIDSDAWQIVPELVPLEGEKIIRKIFRSSFEHTDLEDVLSTLEVGHLFICGAQTNNCVRHTIHAALEGGYDVTLVSDAHTASDYEWRGHKVVAKDVINEQNDNLSGYKLPGRSAHVTKSSAITF